MYADHSISFSKEYPYGVFCPCGLTIHIKADEVKIGYNDIQCPKCGFVAGLTVNGRKMNDDMED